MTRALRSVVILSILVMLPPLVNSAGDVDAAQIVRAAIDHWRGVSSVSEMTMVIHRPDWERSMSMRAWTKGSDKSIVRVTAPPKDRGNGTLTDGNNMWSYAPKINRVIKIPSSMMAQSWMGSDFSNKDVARSDDIVDQYDHSLLDSNKVDGHTVYRIQSIPHEDAPIVWGKEVLRIGDDKVLLEHQFFDQDGKLVKILKSLKITTMGGRVVPSVQRMSEADATDKWTEIRLDAASYDIRIGANLFTLSNLRNPRDQ